METIIGGLLMLVASGVVAAAVFFGLRARAQRAQGVSNQGFNTGGGRVGTGPTSYSDSMPTRVHTGEDVVQDGGRQFLEINGDEVEIRGRGRFRELKAFGADKKIKVHTDPNTGQDLRKFTVNYLAGPRLLIQQPMAEGGELAYFLYDNRTRELPPGFSNTLAAQAKLFAQSDQTAELYLDAFSKKWRLHDIQWFEVDITEGEMFVRPQSGKRPTYRALLCKCGDEWLFFADLQSGGEGGSMCWIGREFDPKVEVRE